MFLDRTNRKSQSEPRILSPEQLKKIHQTILDVIANTGMQIVMPPPNLFALPNPTLKLTKK